MRGAEKNTSHSKKARQKTRISCSKNGADINRPGSWPFCPAKTAFSGILMSIAAVPKWHTVEITTIAKCSVSLMTASYRLVGWRCRIRLGRMTPGEMPPTKLILSGTLGGSPLIHIYRENNNSVAPKDTGKTMNS